MHETLIDVPIQGTDSDERFTPRWVFEALGETFDTDPASPVGLETFVPATTRYTRVDDGLTQPWHGFVWLNPPYSNSTPWARRFIDHGCGLWLGPVANAAWHDEMMRTSSAVWMMRDFAFVHPTHKGKRSSMPLSMHAYGDRAVRALERATSRLPAAGVLVKRAESPEQEPTDG